MGSIPNRVVNIKTGKQLYRHLVKECKNLPSDAEKFYLFSIKQSFKQHADENDQQRIEEIIERALEDAAWIKNKYNISN